MVGVGGVKIDNLCSRDSCTDNLNLPEYTVNRLQMNWNLTSAIFKTIFIIVRRQLLFIQDCQEDLTIKLKEEFKGQS